MGHTPLVVFVKDCHDSSSDDFQELQPSTHVRGLLLICINNDVE